MFDRSPDPSLDELTELSAVLSNADYAYIGWMDSNRLWFKSQFGFKATDQPRPTTACQWMLETGQPFLIRDAAQDSRFPPAGIPLMGAKPCRSYAGVPLISGSLQIIGTLAVLAREPARFSQEHLTLLEVLARRSSLGSNSMPASVPRSKHSALASVPNGPWPWNAASWPLPSILFRHWLRFSIQPDARCASTTPARN